MAPLATKGQNMAGTKTSKPPVIDAKGNTLELRMKVIYDEKSKTEKTLGHITGLEYQRGRVVIQPADGGKLDVRPASKVRVEKSKSGKILRVEKAVRAGAAKKESVSA
jgi:hypothetical protein